MKHLKTSQPKGHLPSFLAKAILVLTVAVASVSIQGGTRRSEQGHEQGGNQVCVQGQGRSAIPALTRQGHSLA